MKNSQHKNCMTLIVLLLGCVFMSACVGCAGTSRNIRKDTPPDFGSISSWGASSGSASGTGIGTKNGTRVGKGKLTILLAQYNQPDKLQLAQGLLRRARRLLGTNDIWLLKGQLGMAVNYGHFRTQNEAGKKLIQVKKIYSKLQAGPWQFPFIKEIPEPNPSAPEEWNLLNNNCEFSLEIATYYDDPKNNYYGRKIDAVKAVQSLRQSGEIACFVHGNMHSRVYVGCLSREHFRPVRKDGQMKISLSPQARLLQKKYPVHYEQGNKVYVIKRDEKGREVKNVVPSKFIEVEMLKRELPY